MHNNVSDYHYAKNRLIHFDEQSRFEKAEKIYLILKDKYPNNISEAVVLDIGCSTGYIDQWLAEKVKYVYGVDIDLDVVSAVKEVESKTDNFKFVFSPGHSLPFHNGQFDIIISNIMYYLLPPAAQEAMFKEIERCLKPHGVCYFAAPNKLLLCDGKYRLPFLCWMPVWLGRIYVKACSKLEGYHEYYKTIFGLKRMVKRHFVCEDMTLSIIDNAEHYKLMKIKNRLHFHLIRFAARIFYVFLPNYIFILYKKDPKGAN